MSSLASKSWTDCSVMLSRRTTDYYTFSVENSRPAGRRPITRPPTTHGPLRSSGGKYTEPRFEETPSTVRTHAHLLFCRRKGAFGVVLRHAVSPVLSTVHRARPGDVQVSASCTRWCFTDTLSERMRPKLTRAEQRAQQQDVVETSQSGASHFLKPPK